MRDPDKAGAVGRAWESRYDPGDDPAFASHVCGWIVNGPWHNAWSWWMVGAVDLLDRPGVDPPKRHYPEAEFEIMIVSLDPKCYPPDPDAPRGLSFLTPPDLVYQFDGLSREAVTEIVGLMIDHIVAGRSPDSDMRSEWERSLATTVEHYREGRHGPAAQQ